MISRCISIEISPIVRYCTPTYSLGFVLVTMTQVSPSLNELSFRPIPCSDVLKGLEWLILFLMFYVIPKLVNVSFI